MEELIEKQKEAAVEAFFTAIKQCDVHIVKTMLAGARSSVVHANMLTEETKRPALHAALRQGLNIQPSLADLDEHLALIQELISHGADVSLKCPIDAAGISVAHRGVTIHFAGKSALDLAIALKQAERDTGPVDTLKKEHWDRIINLLDTHERENAIQREQGQTPAWMFPSSSEEHTQANQAFTDKWKKMWTERLHTDVEFSFDDISCSTTIAAHKAVLSVSSPVFAAMFNGAFEESVSRTIHCQSSDIFPSALENMLEFLYCGQLPKQCVESCDAALSLLEAAERYQVDDLKRMLSIHLASTLDLSNCLQILIQSDRHNVHELKEKTMAFIVEHYDQLMERQDHVMELGKHHPALWSEIMRAVSVVIRRSSSTGDDSSPAPKRFRAVVSSAGASSSPHANSL